MKTTKLGRVLFATAIFVMGGFGLAGLHAQDKSANTQLSVTIRTADQLAVAQTDNLDFGGIFLDKVNPSTVTMDKAGVVTTTNGLLYDTDLQQLGGFRVMADAGFPYSLDFPTTLNLLLTGSPTDLLVYTAAVYDATGAAVTPSTTAKRNMGVSGVDQFGVAGSVLVPAAAKTGLYTANLDVTVTWE